MTKYVDAEKLIDDLESRKRTLTISEKLTNIKTEDRLVNDVLNQAITAINLHAEEKPNYDDMPNIYEKPISEVEELKERIALLEAIYEIDQATIKKLFKANKLLKEHINQY